MKAVLKDGSEIECGWFQISDGGALLRKNGKRGELVGFVPMDELRTIAPDDYEPVTEDGDNQPADTGDVSGNIS